ncbi:MAG: serine hydrolase [Eubacteriales bacterium]|nr:serine hydrolase [Eubacteriales bacterium]
MKQIISFIRKHVFTALVCCAAACICTPGLSVKASETTASEAAETASEINSDGESGTESISSSSQSENSPEMDAVITSLSDYIAERAAVGEDWSAGFIDLTALQSCYLESESMQAASLIKLYIMGAVYESYDSLCSTYGTDNIDSLLYSMITVSDNDAANTLTSYLGSGDDSSGRQAVNDYCQRYGYEDSFMGRMLLAPADNGDNYTSVKDCCKFLLKIYHQEISHAPEMMSLLQHQERTHKIPQGIPEGVQTANKTGELSDVENDAAVIFAQHPYIFVVMSQNLSDVGTAQSNIASLSSTVYFTLNQ